MGQDIHGWVEIRPGGKGCAWKGIIDAGRLLVRNYDATGFLFGKKTGRTYNPPSDKDPVAGIKGLPSDISFRTKEELLKSSNPEFKQKLKNNELDELNYGNFDFHSFTWISQKELNKVDWQDPLQYMQPPALVYNEEEDFLESWAAIRDIPELMELEENFSEDEIEPGEEQKLTVAEDSTRYNVEKGDEVVVRKEEVDESIILSEGSWEVLVKLMSDLGDEYGDKNVRFVAWFDN